MRNKRHYYLFISVVAVVAAAICVYDVTQRYGHNNFGAFLSLVLTLAFVRWSIYYYRKWLRCKAEHPAGR